MGREQCVVVVSLMKLLHDLHACNELIEPVFDTACRDHWLTQCHCVVTDNRQDLSLLLSVQGEPFDALNANADLSVHCLRVRATVAQDVEQICLPDKKKPWECTSL